MNFAENRIVLAVKVIGSGKEKRKDLPYFFDIDKPDNSRETVNLVLHECIFPTNNSRRVNFGESLTLYHERSKEAFKKIVKDNNISCDKSLYFVLQLFSGKEYHIVCKSIDVQVIQLN